MTGNQRAPTAVYIQPDPPSHVNAGSFWLDSDSDTLRHRNTADSAWVSDSVTSITASAAIPANRLVMASGAVGTLANLTTVGVNTGTAKVAGQPVPVGTGIQTCVAAQPITAGDRIKCTDNGRITRFHETALIDGAMMTPCVGSAFANQTSNEGAHILSDSAADILVPVTIIGITTGTHTLVTETKTTHASNGTTAVTTAKTNWGVLLAIKKPVTVGTITIQEASGDATIITLAPTLTQVGVVAIAAADQGTNGLAAYADADAGTTKEIGCKYEPVAGGAEVYWAAALNGTTDIPITASNRITEFYIGDVEAARTVALKTNHTADSTLTGMIVGKAIDTFTTGGTGRAYISPA